MTTFRSLMESQDYRVRMVAVRHAWAIQWRKACDTKRAAENFAEAHKRIHEIKRAIDG